MKKKKNLHRMINKMRILSLSKLGQMSLDECVSVFLILTCPIKKGRDLSTSVIGFCPREVRIKETQDSCMQVPCSRKERKNKVSALTNTQYFSALLGE